MHEFTDDDHGYGCLLQDHPAAFVLNVRRNPSVSYTVLHRATCKTISQPKDAGAYTARGYRKVAAEAVDELRRYIRSLRSADGSFSAACGQCAPLSD